MCDAGVFKGVTLYNHCDDIYQNLIDTLQPIRIKYISIAWYHSMKRGFTVRSHVCASFFGPSLCELQADELEYTFKRLVDGLAHIREAARPGFSLALGQVSGDDYQNQFNPV